jgi:hypothetical protein
MIEKKHAHIVTNMALAAAAIPAGTFRFPQRQQEGANTNCQP